MSHDAGSRILAKLVLLQQACCDPRIDSSAKATLAVILDACYDKPSCFIGPTSIGRITGHHEKTVRSAISALVAYSYLQVEPRNQRSNFLLPNFEHAERTGHLVDWSTADQRVCRPAIEDEPVLPIAGAQARYKGQLAGVQAPESGCAGSKQRARTPTETNLETALESSRADAGAQARPHANGTQAPEQAALKNQLTWIAQHFRVGGFGEGQEAEETRDRLIAEAHRKYSGPDNTAPRDRHHG